MTATNLFHVGILVRNMDEASERFSSALGLTFKEPAIAHVEAFEQSTGMSTLDLRITWSIEGPPYLELLESQDNEGLYAFHEEGLHHIGLWEPNPEELMKKLVRLGLRNEATQWTPEGRILATYTAPDEMYGTRLEFIEEGRRAGMENWLDGGSWADE